MSLCPHDCTGTCDLTGTARCRDGYRPVYVAPSVREFVLRMAAYSGALLALWWLLPA